MSQTDCRTACPNEVDAVGGQACCLPLDKQYLWVPYIATASLGVARGISSKRGRWGPSGWQLKTGRATGPPLLPGI